MSVEGDAGSVRHATVIRGSEPTRQVTETSFNYDKWKITVFKCTILPSICYCDEINSVDSSGNENDLSNRSKCQVCRFETELPLRHLPEMVFPDNCLKLFYKPSGFTMTFNAMDAMKLIGDKCDITVAASAHWQASKVKNGEPLEVLHPYDWTYTTEYQGTTNQGEIESNSATLINVEKLKRREEILFFDEMTLFEDELHDNGISNLTLKIRVMNSGFFILLRFFLRVDRVMARICDTRIHYEKNNDYFIRQFQVRESTVDKLSNVPPQDFNDSNMLYPHLPLVRESNEKIKM